MSSAPNNLMDLAFNIELIELQFENKNYEGISIISDINSLESQLCEEVKLDNFIHKIIGKLEYGPVKRLRDEQNEIELLSLKNSKANQFSEENFKRIIEDKQNRRNDIKLYSKEIKKKILELNLEFMINCNLKSSYSNSFVNFDNYSHWLFENFLYELSKSILNQYTKSTQELKKVVLSEDNQGFYIRNSLDFMPYRGQFSIFVENNELLIPSYQEKIPFSFVAKLRGHYYGVGIEVNSMSNIQTGKEYFMMIIGSLSNNIREFWMISYIERSSLLKYILKPSEQVNIKQFPILNKGLKSFLTKI